MGYLFIGLIILLILLSLLVMLVLLFAAGLVLGGAAVAVAFFAAALVKALRLRSHKPGGVHVSARDVPNLYRYLDELERLTGARRPSAVILDDSCNAGVIRVPGPGPAIPERFYLLLGVPMLMALSVDEFRSVLAHEYAHMSRSEERFAAWVYATRARWLALADAFRTREGIGAAIVDRLFSAYADYFAAYSFPLARENEFHADAFAARLTGTEPVAASLARLEVVNVYLSSEFWPAIVRRADQESIDEVSPFSDLADRLARGAPYAKAAGEVNGAVSAVTRPWDTHPSLPDRLDALGTRAPRLCQPSETALDAFLGDAAPRVVQAIEDLWVERERLGWEARHDLVRVSYERIGEIDATAEPAPVELLIEKAGLLDRMGRVADAMAVYRTVLDVAPNNAKATFALGSHLLALDNDEGIALLEEVVQRDTSARLEASLILRDFHLRHGRVEQAAVHHQEALDENRADRHRQNELVRLPSPESMGPHDLTPAQVEELVDQIRDEPFIQEIYLATRDVAGASQPVYVVGIVGGFQSHSETLAARANRVRGRIKLLPNVQVFVLKGAGRRLRKTFRNIPGSRIF